MAIRPSSRAAALGKAPYLSVPTVAELQGGVVTQPALTALRRRRLDAMLDQIKLPAARRPVTPLVCGQLGDRFAIPSLAVRRRHPS